MEEGRVKRGGCLGGAVQALTRAPHALLGLLAGGVAGAADAGSQGSDLVLQEGQQRALRQQLVQRAGTVGTNCRGPGGGGDGCGGAGTGLQRGGWHAAVHHLPPQDVAAGRVERRRQGREPQEDE